MRIFHCLFTAQLGGLEQAFLDITDGLLQTGHQVSACIRSDAPYNDEVEKLAETYYVDPRGFYDISAIYALRKAIKAAKPDLILAHAPRGIQLCSLAAKGMAIPVCGVMHSYKFKRIHKAQHIVALTEHMKQAIIAHHYPEAQITVIPNSIILPDEKPTLQKRDNVLSVGAIARLVPEKGLDHLIEAAALLLQGETMPLEIHVAGVGPEKEHLEKLAAKHRVPLVLHGWVKDKAAFFATLDACCVPSLYEPYGIVLAESFIHGVPVVAYASEGPSSIITHGQNGLLASVGDKEALAAQLQVIADSAELAGKLVEEGWSYAQNIARPVVAKKWDALVRRLSSPVSQQPAASE
jgi:glycosyltransferase involved in cell wall biosynthesis